MTHFCRRELQSRHRDRILYFGFRMVHVRTDCSTLQTHATSKYLVGQCQFEGITSYSFQEMRAKTFLNLFLGIVW
jgi:hypothetical protein